jgi:hypothetical protein
MAPHYLQMNTEHMTHLEEHGFIHQSVNHLEKEYANGIVHVNNYVNVEVICIRYG